MSRLVALTLALALLAPVLAPAAAAYPIPEGPVFLVRMLVVTVVVCASAEVQHLNGQGDGCLPVPP